MPVIDISSFTKVYVNWLNSSPPSFAYMRQWIGSALVQTMDGRRFGAKPLSKPMLDYCQLASWGQTSVKFQLKKIIIIQKSAFEIIVCEMAAILSRGRWVKSVESHSHLARAPPAECECDTEEVKEISLILKNEQITADGENNFNNAHRWVWTVWYLYIHRTSIEDY